MLDVFYWQLKHSIEAGAEGWVTVRSDGVCPVRSCLSFLTGARLLQLGQQVQGEPTALPLGSMTFQSMFCRHSSNEAMWSWFGIRTPGLTITVTLSLGLGVSSLHVLAFQWARCPFLH